MGSSVPWGALPAALHPVDCLQVLHLKVLLGLGGITVLCRAERLALCVIGPILPTAGGDSLGAPTPWSQGKEMWPRLAWSH